MQSLAAQSLSQTFVVRLKVFAETEEPDLRGRVGGGHDPVVIPRATIVGRGALPPLIFSECVMDDDVERRQRAEQERDCQPWTKRNQNRAHRDERDAVLQQRAEVAEQRHGPVTSFRTRAMQVIVVIRELVEREITVTDFS